LTKTANQPKTMAELLATAVHCVSSFSVGQKVKGKIVAINPHSLVIDIGAKSEGIVAEKAYVEARDFIKGLKVGDELMTTVIVPEAKDGTILLSLRQASYESTWGKLEKAEEEGKEVNVVGRAVNPSGVMVEIEGLNGFIPTSQLGKGALQDLEGLIGRSFKAKILEINKENNKILLSEKEVSEKESMQASKDALAKIKVGEVYEGKVTTVANFGCFVKLDLGEDINLEGLVHVSELSWGKVGSPSEIVKVGDKVKVKVLEFKGGKIALSMKHAEADPWEKVEEKYKTDAKIKGKVTRVSDFGVFVEIEKGVEGLIHITNIPPGEKLTEGKEVNCYVQEVDSKNKKLSLGLVLTSKPVNYK
jgi:small subunit ribosomal protein S1